MNTFEECTDDYQRREGAERWIRRIDPLTFISVLHRRTGFGYMEWETALVFKYMFHPGDHWKDRDVLIIVGDRRDELATMPKEQLRAWYAVNIEGNRNSLETFIHTAKEAIAV